MKFEQNIKHPRRTDPEKLELGQGKRFSVCCTPFGSFSWFCKKEQKENLEIE
jgi:hypothetical protein